MVCVEMGWTEEEFIIQRWSYILELYTFINERNKKLNGKQ